MKNKKKLLNLIPLLIISAVVVAFLLPSFSSEAGVFPALYFYKSRMKANLVGTGVNAVEFVLALTTTQAFDAGTTSITIYFPDGASHDTLWCRTGGVLTATGVTASAADQATSNWDIDAVLPFNTGGFTATCVQAAAGDPDKITLTNVGALTTGTTYGVKFETSTGILGTGNSTAASVILVELKEGVKTDYGSFEFRLLAEDQVTIDAIVSALPSITCTLTPTTVDLGTLMPGASFATGTSTITTTTSATAEGYYWVVYGKGNDTNSGLWKSASTTYLIQSGAADTQDLRGIGTEGFGLTASPPTNTGGTVATRFVDTTFGIFGTLGVSGTPGAKMLLHKASAQTTTSSSTITFGGRAGTTAEPGTYQEKVTFVCGGYY